MSSVSAVVERLRHRFSELILAEMRNGTPTPEVCAASIHIAAALASAARMTRSEAVDLWQEAVTECLARTAKKGQGFEISFGEDDA